MFRRMVLVTLFTFAAAASCDRATTEPQPATGLAFERNAQAFEFSDPNSFIPAASSPTCSVGGGLEQVVLPTGFVATIVGSEPSFPDNGDMHTVNETGAEPGRFLYRTHETGSNAAVSVTDLETGVSRVLARRADWERFDGIAWTPWGTLLAAEEASPAGQRDPDFPGSLSGLVYEIDPATGGVHARPALGSKAHEGMRFDAQGNFYGISERAPGYIYKFVPARRGDLSSGRMYVMKIVLDLGDRTGWAEWVELDQAQVEANADIAADAVGATAYSRPEDVETGASTGNDRRGQRMLYVAITGEDRVLAIDLQAGTGQRAGQVFVSDYVKEGVNAPADFDLPDNLALDQEGNLLIAEDPGGSAPSKTKGDDVWLARFDPASQGRSQPIVRFFSITDCNAEPTGIYFSKSGRSLFVNIQHRSGDGRDASIAIQRIANAEFIRQ